MYIQKTKFYCSRCGTHDHWANEMDQCRGRVGSSTVEHLPVEQEVVGSTPIQPAIEKAKEFIKKVGRPKVYPDRKTQMRELMRRKRARKK
jgi:hypothetical protein